MVDIDFLYPLKEELIWATHTQVLSRATGGTGVVSGNKITPAGGMSVKVDAGRIRVDGMPVNVSESTITLTSANQYLDRIDIILRTSAGVVQAVSGNLATVNDPKGVGNWHQYESPSPANSIPAGAILGAVYIPAGLTQILESHIWMFAGRVEDILTTAGSPGSDDKVLSEKASVAAFAPATRGVTNGDLHNHDGGDGGQISHTKLSEIGTNTHAAIDSHLVNTANPHNVTAAQVGANITTGTVHAATSKTTPIDNDEIGLLDSAASYVLKKLTWSNLKATLKTYFDTYYILRSVLTTQGDIMVRDASGPARLGKGTTGQRLAQGANDPAWVTSTFEVAFPFGDGLADLIAGNYTIPIPIASKIVSASIRSVDAAGAPLSGSVTCTLYKHARDAALGTAVDSFALNNATNMVETGLNIAVAANDWITIVTSGITSVKQITCVLVLEVT